MHFWLFDDYKKRLTCMLLAIDLTTISVHLFMT